MRIIAGKYRGRRIEMPKGVKIRPTQDRVREAVFNIIRTKLEGAEVLDLFAGSGAFGIESISRGASVALFVDTNFKCVQTIKKNLGSLGIETFRDVFYSIVQKTSLENRKRLYEIWHMDALSAIKKLDGQGRRFDIVFLDPPYYKNLAKKTLISINDCDILKHSGIVVAEHHKKDQIPQVLDRIELFTHRVYGDIIISIYRYTQ